MSITGPIAVARELQEAYLRYYDTAFRLRDEGLMSERRALLEEPGALFTEPYIEPVLGYESTESIAAACQSDEQSDESPARRQ